VTLLASAEASINRIYGFYDECRRRYSGKVGDRLVWIIVMFVRVLTRTLSPCLVFSEAVEDVYRYI
jgi:hypothetical protein